jgi:hypothetical protein
MKHPDPKKHQLISFAKSGIRIIASFAAALAVTSHIQLAIILLAIGYAAAEVVGVYEELV